MKNGKPVYYWDSAPLIAWLTNEKQRTPAEMAGISAVMKQVQKNEAIVITSVLWRTEFLPGSITRPMHEKPSKVFQRSNFTEVAADMRVMELAGKIRDHYLNKKRLPSEIGNVKTPDAIHLATAIHYKADEFHTFDGKRQGRIGGLIALSGNVAGHQLRICAPNATQYEMDYSKPVANNPEPEIV